MILVLLEDQVDHKAQDFIRMQEKGASGGSNGATKDNPAILAGVLYKDEDGYEDPNGSYTNAMVLGGNYTNAVYYIESKTNTMAEVRPAMKTQEQRQS